jgi:hypothetical protein
LFLLISIHPPSLSKGGLLDKAVKFTFENWEKCKCVTCPVQAENPCFQEKNVKTIEIMPKIKETNMVESPEMFPGMYCVNGKTTCRNLDTKTNMPMLYLSIMGRIRLTPW